MVLAFNIDCMENHEQWRSRYRVITSYRNIATAFGTECFEKILLFSQIFKAIPDKDDFAAYFYQI